MPASTDFKRELWHAIGLALTAHAIMLRDTAIVDDAVAAALLTAIDGVRRGEPPDIDGSLGLVASFDDRVDSLVAAGAAGAVRIGRSRHDLATTAQRLVLRDRLLALVSATDATRSALLDLSESHVFTLLPIWSSSEPLQPTNFAHFLTGTLAPLARSARGLRIAYDDLDRSPLGSAASVGPAFPIDRDEVSDLLGSEAPTESTFDALSAVDHLIATAAAAANSVAPLRRLVEELLVWLRTDPQSLRLDDETHAQADPNLPHFRPASNIHRLIAAVRRVEEDASTVGALVRDVPYGPVGETTDEAVEMLIGALERATAAHESFVGLLTGSIEINRAWLARSAGRGLVTAGDLAVLLMAEEGVEPSAAGTIAAQVVSRAMGDGLEASEITPEMIDAAALLTIGRELGIEVERLGAWLAPRRFIEKRAVLGGPAPAAIREHLASERHRVADDARWVEAKQQRIALASENLDIRTNEVLAAASSG